MCEVPTNNAPVPLSSFSLDVPQLFFYSRNPGPLQRQYRTANDGGLRRRRVRQRLREQQVQREDCLAMRPQRLLQEHHLRLYQERQFQGYLTKANAITLSTLIPITRALSLCLFRCDTLANLKISSNDKFEPTVAPPPHDHSFSPLAWSGTAPDRTLDSPSPMW